MLFVQHDVHWIEAGLPGEGNLLIFNNGTKRVGSLSYSTVDELTTPVNEDGVYTAAGDGAFGPENFSWTYEALVPEDFYSPSISGAQRLPNGNTLICSGTQGGIFEVTPEGSIVWEYINPVTRSGGAAL